MSDAVLALLKICFLVVLYLFIARVVRAVWVEIRSHPESAPPPGASPNTTVTTSTAPAGAPNSRTEAKRRRGDGWKEGDGRKGRRGRRTKPSDHLKIVEPPILRGVRFPVTDEMTIGRGQGCAVCIDDTFASQLHARVFRRDGRVFVEDLGSTNGTWLNRKRVHGPLAILPGDRLQVGHTVLEIER